MQAYTQSRADTRPALYPVWAAASIGGGIAAAYGALQEQGGLVTLGLLGVCLGVALMYRGRSTSLPALTGMESVPSTYAAEDRVRTPDNASDRAARLAKRLADCDEVTETVIRPTPNNTGEFVEVQLNGPYVSRRFKRAVVDADGTPRMRPFGTDEYYRLYILLD